VLDDVSKCGDTKVAQKAAELVESFFVVRVGDKKHARNA
jgi:hypothetical protein